MQGRRPVYSSRRQPPPEAKLPHSILRCSVATIHYRRSRVSRPLFQSLECSIASVMLFARDSAETSSGGPSACGAAIPAARRGRQAGKPAPHEVHDTLLHPLRVAGVDAICSSFVIRASSFPPTPLAGDGRRNPLLVIRHSSFVIPAYIPCGWRASKPADRHSSFELRHSRLHPLRVARVETRSPAAIPAPAGSFIATRACRIETKARHAGEDMPIPRIHGDPATRARFAI